MSSKRQSMMPAAPPTPIDFVTDRTTPGAGGSVVIADAVAVVGTFPVTIHGDSVIHPRARLDARGGPVNIGRRCIVEERAVLGGGEGSVTLANYVSVETGATVEAGAILGEGSVIGPRCHVGSGAVVGKYCTLAPRSRIAPGERLSDFTVVYGAGPQRQRRDGRTGAVDARHKQQTRKIEVLRKLITSVPEKYMVS